MAKLSNTDSTRSIVEKTLLISPAGFIMAAFFVLPLLGLLALSVLEPSPTLEHYREFLGNGANWTILGRTFLLALVVTALNLLLGYPLAYWIVRANKWVAGLLMFAVVLPFFTSYLVRTYAWMVILGRFGIVNQALIAVGAIERPLNLIYNEFSVTVAMVYVLMPFTVLVLLSVMKGIPTAYTRAAASLGASKTQNFWRIFFPLSGAGVTASGLLVFVFALGFYITPALLGGPKTITLPMLIDVYINGTLNWPLAAATAAVLLLVTMVFYAISNHYVGVDKLLGSAQSATAGADSASKGGGSAYWACVEGVTAVTHFLRTKLGVSAKIFECAEWMTGWALKGLCVLLAVFLLAPILIIVPISFSSSKFLDFPPPGFSMQWYMEYLNSDSWLAATMQSFKVGIGAAALSLVIGSGAAIALVRSGPKMRKYGYQLLLAPLIVPVIVSAVALYFLFAKIGLVNTSFGLVLAHSIGAIPLVVLIVAAGFQGQNERLEHAAASLGANRLATYLRIIIPLLKPSLVVAGFFAFLHSFDEVVQSVFVSGPDTMTLPVKMWSGIREEISPTIAAVSTLMILLTVVVHFGIEVYKKMSSRGSH